MEPKRILLFKQGFHIRTLESASKTFSLDYYTITKYSKSCWCGRKYGKTIRNNIQFEYMPNSKTLDTELNAA
jgi:hypothetical protein